MIAGGRRPDPENKSGEAVFDRPHRQSMKRLLLILIHSNVGDIVAARHFNAFLCDIFQLFCDYAGCGQEAVRSRGRIVENFAANPSGNVRTQKRLAPQK